MGLEPGVLTPSVQEFFCDHYFTACSQLMHWLQAVFKSQQKWGFIRSLNLSGSLGSLRPETSLEIPVTECKASWRLSPFGWQRFPWALVSVVIRETL